jgi:hypothetical protein
LFIGKVWPELAVVLAGQTPRLALNQPEKRHPTIPAETDFLRTPVMIPVIGLSIPTHAGELEEALPIALGHAVLIAANDAKICVASINL